MSGILNLSRPDLSAPEPLKALPRSLGERVSATADVIFSPDRYFNIADTRQAMWQRSVDELHATTGKTFLNPYASVTAKEAMAPDFSPGDVVKRRQDAIINAARLAKANGNEDLFDPENIDRYIAEDVRRREQKAASFEGTGNGIGNFIASIGMSSVEPINILALGLPVSRLPSATASIIGRTFLGNVAREAALQAGANVAMQGMTEALDYAGKSEIGTQASPGEIAGNLAAAAGFGAVLGGGIRALHLKWLGLPEKVRADAPLEVRDAFKVIEADTLYSGQNRIGLDPAIHERYQGRAYDAVMRGQPVRLEDLTPADTPMTALGTILRAMPQDGGPPPGTVRVYHGGGVRPSALDELHVTTSLNDAEGWASRSPDMRIWYADVPRDSPWLRKFEGTDMIESRHVATKDALGLFRPLDEAPARFNIRGLPQTLDRVRMLPDTELEPIVRQLKPQAFSALDAIDAKLRALDERVAAIHGEAQQIGLTDIIDLDTAALINDAVEGLKKPNLSRRERQALEHQRDTWLQSVDPRGEMAGELERTRNEFFPEHGSALKEIAAEREKLLQERIHAQGEAQREVDFLRSKLDKIDFAKPEQALKDIGVTAPADLPGMLQRAEFERQIRLQRELMPSAPAAPQSVSPSPVLAREGIGNRPEAQVAAQIDTEVARLSIDAPDISIDGRTVPAAQALEDADRAIADAKAAQTCLAGGGGIP